MLPTPLSAYCYERKISSHLHSSRSCSNGSEALSDGNFGWELIGKDGVVGRFVKGIPGADIERFNKEKGDFGWSSVLASNLKVTLSFLCSPFFFLSLLSFRRSSSFLTLNSRRVFTRYCIPPHSKANFLRTLHFALSLHRLRTSTRPSQTPQLQELPIFGVLVHPL